jgi:hypothetical protein
MFYFPATNTPPRLGTGFDLIRGEPLDSAAFDSGFPEPTPTLHAGFYEQYGMTQDTKSYSDAVSKQLELSGRGWGATVGLALAESSFSATNFVTVSLNYDAYTLVSYSQVAQEATLSAHAQTLLDKNDGSFQRKYGNYFVAGYQFGLRCSLAFNMRFTSEEKKSAFAAALSGSYSAVDFGTDMAAKITQAVTLSKSTYLHDCTKAANGFKPDLSPTSPLEGIDKVARAFINEKYDGSSKIRLLILPWSYLHAVEGGAKLEDSEQLQDLARMVTKLDYVVRSCDDFVTGLLYTGKTQLENVLAVHSSARQKLDTITEFLQKNSATGTKITSDDVKRYQTDCDPESEITHMDDAFKDFVVSFTVHLATDGSETAGDSPCTDTAGAKITCLDKIIDGRKGIRLNWSKNHANQDWNNYSGTDMTYYIVGNSYGDNGLTASIRLLLNQSTGELQIWRTAAGASVADAMPYLSPPLKIRGSANGLDCTNKDSGGISLNLPGGVVLKACAM